jgi:hypothetical protein
MLEIWKFKSVKSWIPNKTLEIQKVEKCQKFFVIWLVIFFIKNYGDAAFIEVASHEHKRFYITTETKVSTIREVCLVTSKAILVIDP